MKKQSRMIMGFIELIKTYFKINGLILTTLAGLIVTIGYLLYSITINNLQFSYADEKKINESLLKFFRSDFEHKFIIEDFKYLYSDLGYLLETKQVSAGNLPVEKQIENARYSFKMTKSLENFEKYRLYSLIDKIRNRLPELTSMYIIPMNTTQKINIYYDLQNRSMTLLEESRLKNEVLNKMDNFYTFEAFGSKIYFDKKQILVQYNKNLAELILIAKMSESNIKKNMIDTMKFFIVVLFVLSIIFFAIFALTLFKHYNQFIKEREVKFLNLAQTEQKIITKEKILQIIEHTMQHDVKTNLDERLDNLNFLYNDLNLYKDLFASNALTILKDRILYLYALDLTIKMSNDFILSEDIKIPHFISYFKNEKIFKFANGEYETFGLMGSKIIDRLIKIEISKKFENVKDFAVNNKVYENELTSFIFRLINNALKHSYNRVVNIKIDTDINNNFMITIANKVQNPEKCLYEIETSLMVPLSPKNISLVYNQINRFGLNLKFEKNDIDSLIIAKIERII